MKKIVSLLLILCTVLGLAPITAVYAAESTVYQASFDGTMVDVLEIIGSASHCESNDVANSTVQVDTACTLNIPGEGVFIGISKILDKSDITWEPYSEYEPIHLSNVNSISTHDSLSPDAPDSSDLSEGSYFLDIIYKKSHITTKIIVGNNTEETTEKNDIELTGEGTIYSVNLSSTDENTNSEKDVKFEFVGSESYCKNQNVTESTVYINNKCVLKISCGDMKVRLYAVCKGTDTYTYKKFREQGRLDVIIDKMHIFESGVSEIELSEGEYILEITDNEKNGLVHLVVGGDEEFEVVSDWAKAEVVEARLKNLVPEEMLEDNLTEVITRAESAAIAVQLYEQLSDEEIAFPIHIRAPITDYTGNKYASYIVKAYYGGIVSGTNYFPGQYEIEFSPDLDVTREQLSTMLMNVIKKQTIDGWYAYNPSEDYLLFVSLGTYGSDKPLKFDNGETTFDISDVKPFADDEQISDYAREAVYYLSKQGITKGIDASHFAPQGTATKEQAIIMALRCYDTLFNANEAAE